MKIDPQKSCVNYEESIRWAIIHDVIAHPIMALTLYSTWSVRLHDYTSSKAWNRK
jgi:hypothetical protein